MAKKSFKEAFAEAIKAGKKTFPWDGKKYTTELREAEAPKSSPKPRARPSSSSSGSRSSTSGKPSEKPVPERKGRSSVPRSGTSGRPTTRKSNPGAGALKRAAEKGRTEAAEREGRRQANRKAPDNEYIRDRSGRRIRRRRQRR